MQYVFGTGRDSLICTGWKPAPNPNTKKKRLYVVMQSVQTDLEIISDVSPTDVMLEEFVSPK